MSSPAEGLLGQHMPTSGIDSGTHCRVASPVAGPLDGLACRDPLEDALHALEATALNANLTLINDAKVRANYLAKIRAMSVRVRLDVRAGLATVEEGVSFASQMRNIIMEETRAQTSSVGRSVAEASKATGMTLEAALQKATGKLFPGKAFEQLGKADRRKVFLEIIKASGRSSPRFTTAIPRWQRLGRGCALFTAGISVYNIWTADNKVKAGLSEGLVLGGGATGGALAGAATGLVCGPGAPVCSTALFVVGGIMGAFAGDAAGRILDDELTELADWLVEAT